MSALLPLAAALVGAGVMYLLDPDGGRRRRALVRDQLVRAANRTGDAVDATSRDVTNRARGVVAELRSRLGGDEHVGDELLRERVRARIGAVVRHASAIETAVDQGRVTLSGPILAADVDRLMRRVRAVRGVRDVENRLEVHAEPGGVPALQGQPRPPRGGEVFELLQRTWSPATRATVGGTGIGLAVWGVRRRDVWGAILALTGLGLVARASANVSLAEQVTRARRRGARS